MVKTCSSKFRLNERFKEKTMDDRNVESIVSLVDASDDDDVDEENVAEEKVGSGNKKMKLVHKQTDKVF